MKRVVIAGLGDTGVLVAMGLVGEVEVVGITPKPALVSGQELGMRVARPDDWRKHYLVGFERYRALRGVQVRHGLVEQLDVTQSSLTVRGASGSFETLSYDALVLSPGVTNGFWRTPTIETREAVDGAIDTLANELAAARSIAVIASIAVNVSSSGSSSPSRRRAARWALMISSGVACTSDTPWINSTMPCLRYSAPSSGSIRSARSSRFCHSAR